MQPIKVFFVCPGLGHVARGYETFTRESFDALRSDERLDANLFQGRGAPGDHQYVAWCLRRNQGIARLLGSLSGHDGYYIECATFAMGLIPHITLKKPDVVYYSDLTVGNMLWRWRCLSGWRYRLLLCNGGVLGPPAFPRIDHVHQVLAFDYELSLQSGRSADATTLLPLGFRIARDFRQLSDSERSALRSRLGLPVDRPIVLSVGMIDRSIKRMDLLVRELARLPTPRPYLVLLGQPNDETEHVLEIARGLLGETGFECRTVSAATINEYYDAADLFVLASRREGFGRVLVEALARGLPCVAADQPFARLVLRDQGYFCEFERPGQLAWLISSVLATEKSSAMSAARHRAAYEWYSWDRLADRYVEMITKCADTAVSAYPDRAVARRSVAVR
jgi:glycosyltransferase involved in cell wall biosynthesis